MSRFVLQPGLRLEDIEPVIRQTQAAVVQTLDGIEPKRNSEAVLTQLHARKKSLKAELGGIDSRGMLNALTDEGNTDPEAVRIREYFTRLRRAEERRWSRLLLDKRFLHAIVSEELEMGILEAIKAGVDFRRYAREDVMVRRAEKKDAAEIIGLLALGAKERYGMDRLPNEKEAEIRTMWGRYYLGIVEGKVVGVMAFHPIHPVGWSAPVPRIFEGKKVLAQRVTKGTAPYIKDEYILPQYRTRGVTEALLDRIIEDAGESGTKDVCIAAETRENLATARRAGFTILGVCLSCPLGPRCGGSLMRKRLDT